MFVFSFVWLAALGSELLGGLGSHSVMLLYLGPETLMPLASILGVVVGFLLIFWRLLLSPFKKLVKMIKGNQSDPASGDASLSE